MAESRLEVHLDKLLQWLTEVGPVPDYREIRILKEPVRRGQNQPTRVPSRLLLNSRDYESQFEQLFQAGHAWIRLGAVGIFEDKLVISVDTSDSIGLPPEHVAVNMAGPAQRVSQNANWRLDWKLADE